MGPNVILDTNLAMTPYVPVTLERAFFSTCPSDRAGDVVACFIKRGIETTFEESRAHLGFETQRQWSDLAIERTAVSAELVFAGGVAGS